MHQSHMTAAAPPPLLPRSPVRQDGLCGQQVAAFTQILNKVVENSKTMKLPQEMSCSDSSAD